MIEFHKQTDFDWNAQEVVGNWLEELVVEEQKELGELAYIFCSDDYLYDLNVELLDHDTLTDVISFDNTMGDLVGGEVYISVDRVRENAQQYSDSFEDELYRVMAHGLLHFCGYKDKTEDEVLEMRNKEEYYLNKLKNN